MSDTPDGHLTAHETESRAERLLRHGDDLDAAIAELRALDQRRGRTRLYFSLAGAFTLIPEWLQVIQGTEAVSDAVLFTFGILLILGGAELLCERARRPERRQALQVIQAVSTGDGATGDGDPPRPRLGV